MKKLIPLAFASLTLLTISCKSKGAEETPATTSDAPKGIAYQVDVPRSELKWMAFKPSGSHTGIFPIAGGNIYVDGDLITGGKIDINVAGLQVLDLEGQDKADLEGHMKGTIPGKENDFFNVAQYPTATFTILGSTKLDNDPLGTHMINGQLTIKDITKPVNFKAVVDLSSGMALKATAEPFVIDRTEWGISIMSKKFFDNLKDNFVNDEVKIQLTIGAVKG